jgi:hypothetical protein
MLAAHRALPARLLPFDPLDHFDFCDPDPKSPFRIPNHAFRILTHG